MSTTPLISVIVPVYNVEKYITRCVESIACQTYSNLEIILVDDGSPDGSGKICDDFAERDSRIKVIHKSNGGLSSARNAGIDASTGQLIAFVDGDDYVSRKMYETLYNALAENGADMSICNCEFVDEDGKTIDGKNSEIKSEVLDKAQALERLNPLLYPYWKYVTAWNKLYKRELFGEIRYPDGKIHEDEFIIHRIIDRCSCVAVTEEPLYKYVQRGGSIMSDKPGDKHVDAVYAFLDRAEYFSAAGNKAMKKIVLIQAYGVLVSMLGRDRKFKHNEYFHQAVKLTLGKLLSVMDPRAAKLMLLWIANRLA